MNWTYNFIGKSLLSEEIEAFLAVRESLRREDWIKHSPGCLVRVEREGAQDHFSMVSTNVTEKLASFSALAIQCSSSLSTLDEIQIRTKPLQDSDLHQITSHKSVALPLELLLKNIFWNNRRRNQILFMSQVFMKQHNPDYSFSKILVVTCLT